MRKIAAILALMLLFSCAKKVPPAKPFDPEESFRAANELIEKKRYEDARRELLEIVYKERDLKYAPLAQLRVADSYQAEKEPELAIEEYKRFLKDYPRHRYAAYAQYQMASIYFGLVEDPERGFGMATKALDEFEKLNEIYPRNPYREEAEARIKESEEIIAAHEFMVGEFYIKKEAWRAALDRFLGLHAAFPGHREAEVLNYIVRSYDGLGDAPKAGEYLKLLIDKYPDSEIAEKAKKEFGR